MDRSSWRRYLAGNLALTTPPTHDRDTRRGRRAALVATGVLAPGLLLVHGLREGEGDVVAIAVAAALIEVLVLARVGRLMADVRALRAAGRFDWGDVPCPACWHANPTTLSVLATAPGGRPWRWSRSRPPPCPP